MMETIPEVFPRGVAEKLGPDLKVLLDQFQCRVCLDPFKDPVMSVVCGHNFCSICIRKYLIYKTQCPDCYHNLHENELKSNRVLGEILHILVTRTLPKIEKSLRWTRPSSSGGNPDISHGPDLEPWQNSTSSRSLKSRKLDDQDPESSLNRMENPGLRVERGSHSDQQRDRSHSISPEKSKAETAEEGESARSLNTSTSGHVSCPVCNVFVPQRHINEHLDRCLKEKENPRQAKVSAMLKTKTSNKRKTMNKLVYHLLKESELRKKCKDVGLDSKGTRKMLISRHQKYVAIWNSQCDLDNPMSPLEIKMMVEKEQQTENREALQAKSLKNSKLNYDRNTDPKEIETKKKEYLTENRSIFNDLVQQIKNRKKNTEKASNDEDLRIESEKSKNFKENKDVSEGPLPEEVLEIEMKKTDSSESLDIFDCVITPTSKSSSLYSVGEKNLPISQSREDNSLDKQSQKSIDSTQDSDFETSDSLLWSPVKDRKKSFQSPPLYITPKKNDSNLKSPKKFHQTGISQAFSTQNEKIGRKHNCPSCNQLVPAAYVNVHLDKCLNPSTLKGNKRKQVDSDEDDDFEDTSVRKSFKKPYIESKKVTDSNLSEEDTECSQTMTLRKGKSLRNPKKGKKIVKK